MRKVTGAAALLSCILLAACASDSSKDAAKRTSPTGTATTTTGYDTGTAARPTATQAAAAAAALPSARVLYFAFDSSELNADALRLVDSWAKYLSANPNARVRLEGHCDERGTREYNIGLGERRALAVRDALTARGVSARQLGVASFGEERPVALGSNEEAWRQNRRVEIVQ
jgi:peptidoglycan-associated lipoprotein